MPAETDAEFQERLQKVQQDEQLLRGIIAMQATYRGVHSRTILLNNQHEWVTMEKLMGARQRVKDTLGTRHQSPSLSMRSMLTSPRVSDSQVQQATSSAHGESKPASPTSPTSPLSPVLSVVAGGGKPMFTVLNALFERFEENASTFVPEVDVILFRRAMADLLTDTLSVSVQADQIHILGLKDNGCRQTIVAWCITELAEDLLERSFAILSDTNTELDMYFSRHNLCESTPTSIQLKAPEPTPTVLAELQTAEKPESPHSPQSTHSKRPAPSSAPASGRRSIGSAGRRSIGSAGKLSAGSTVQSRKEAEEEGWVQVTRTGSRIMTHINGQLAVTVKLRSPHRHDGNSGPRQPFGVPAWQDESDEERMKREFKLMQMAREAALDKAVSMALKNQGDESPQSKRPATLREKPTFSASSPPKRAMARSVGPYSLDEQRLAYLEAQKDRLEQLKMRRQGHKLHAKRLFEEWRRRTVDEIQQEKSKVRQEHEYLDKIYQRQLQAQDKLLSDMEHQRYQLEEDIEKRRKWAIQDAEWRQQLEEEQRQEDHHEMLQYMDQRAEVRNLKAQLAAEKQMLEKKQEALALTEYDCMTEQMIMDRQIHILQEQAAMNENETQAFESVLMAEQQQRAAAWNALMREMIKRQARLDALVDRMSKEPDFKLKATGLARQLDHERRVFEEFRHYKELTTQQRVDKLMASPVSDLRHSDLKEALSKDKQHGQVHTADNQRKQWLMGQGPHPEEGAAEPHEYEAAPEPSFYHPPADDDIRVGRLTSSFPSRDFHQTQLHQKMGSSDGQQKLLDLCSSTPSKSLAVLAAAMHSTATPKSGGTTSWRSKSSPKTMKKNPIQKYFDLFEAESMTWASPPSVIIPIGLFVDLRLFFQLIAPRGAMTVRELQTEWIHKYHQPLSMLRLLDGVGRKERCVDFWTFLAVNVYANYTLRFPGEQWLQFVTQSAVDIVEEIEAVPEHVDADVPAKEVPEELVADHDVDVVNDVAEPVAEDIVEDIEMAAMEFNDLPQRDAIAAH